MKIDGINGDTGPCGDQRLGLGWIRVATLTLGGQTIAATSPWFITPPPGLQTVTLTKETDSSSPGLSAAFASKRTLPTVIIDLCKFDIKGVPISSRYTLRNAVVSSFTVTPPTETLVLSFASLGTGFASEPKRRATVPHGRIGGAPTSSRESIRPGPTATPTPRGGG